MRHAFHPLLPERAGFRRLLDVTEPRLSQLLELGDAFTLMTARNRTTLYREATAVRRAGVPGDFIEIGVHRGGSAVLLAGVIADDSARKLHLFDRWGDLPEPTAKDGFRQQEYTRSNIPDKLSQLKNDNPLLAARELIEQHLGYAGAVYWQGWYEQTFADYDGGAIAFASIDCDYYESVLLALNFVADRASPGCRIVLDDYDTWPGAKAAADEFADLRGASVSRTGLGPALVHL